MNCEDFNIEVAGNRSGRDCSGSLLKQVTLTAEWQWRLKEAQLACIAGKRTCKATKEKSPAACTIKNNCNLMQHFFTLRSLML